MGKSIAIFCGLVLAILIVIKGLDEFRKWDCVRSIEGQITEYGRPEEFAGNGQNWHFMNEEEKRKVFSESKIFDCYGTSDVPAEKKYNLAVRSTGQFGFEIRVWLDGDKFKE